MSQHDDQVYLKHMLDHAREAVDLLAGKSQVDLAQNRILELALTRLIEVIGEAATNVSSGMKSSNPHLPWPEIVGMRNRLIHGYNTVDLKVLWDTISEDLPSLIADLEKIIE